MAEQHLLGLFNDPGHTADFIDEIRKLGIPEDKITVMSGMPYSGAMLGRQRFHAKVSRASINWRFPGYLTGGFPDGRNFLALPAIPGRTTAHPHPHLIDYLF